MRRIKSPWFVVAGFCVMLMLDSSASLGSDDLRTLAFRELTSDEPATLPARTSPVEKSSAPTVSETPSTALGPMIAAPQNGQPAPILAPARATAPPVRQASFYGGNSARQTMSQFPRRAAIRTTPQRSARRQPKPFETAEHEPTISPYLNLDRGEEDAHDVPNYLTFVLPQLQQMQTNRVQQREIQQLRGQLQQMSGGVSAALPDEVGRSARMGSSARFMDTAQFYGGMR